MSGLFWERDGLEFRLVGELPDDVLLQIASSVATADDTTWALTTSAVAERLRTASTVESDAEFGDVYITMRSGGVFCITWQSADVQCAAKSSSYGFATVFEHDGAYHAIGTWETAETLTGTIGFAPDATTAPIDQVQVGPVRLFHAVLPDQAPYGINVQVGTAGTGFSINADG